MSAHRPIINPCPIPTWHNSPCCSRVTKFPQTPQPLKIPLPQRSLYHWPIIQRRNRELDACVGCALPDERLPAQSAFYQKRFCRLSRTLKRRFVKVSPDDQGRRTSIEGPMIQAMFFEISFFAIDVNSSAAPAVVAEEGGRRLPAKAQQLEEWLHKKIE